MASSATLRATLVDRLVSDGVVRSALVESALRAVPRHRFIPEVSRAEAYSDEALVIKRDEHGVALSSLSQPTMVAIMLEQLNVRPGHRVLEIGTGTGYNAALLDRIVGEAGHVTTIEYDPEVCNRSRATLAALGARVEIIEGDGEMGFATNAPYDRIIVTVGAWDIPSAWWEQLAPDGVVVVPLRIGGLQRSIALHTVTPTHWRSQSIQSCGFVPMQGAGAFHTREIRLADSVELFIDDDQPLARGLADSLRFEPELEWTGVVVPARDSISDVELWLLTAARAIGRLSADQDELVAPVPRWGSPAVISDATFAFLTRRPSDDGSVEYGVGAHGPGAAELAAAVAAEVRAWAAAAANGVVPVIEVRHATDPSTKGALAKRQSRLAIEWLQPPVLRA